MSAPKAKWIEGVRSNQSASEVARLVLKVRLGSVWDWLPLAAERSEEEPEHVHQLRVSTRRAVESVRVFSEHLPDEALGELRARLREIRRVADEARNLDVLCAEFVRCADASCEATCGRIAEAIRDRRREAQRPIAALHEALAADGFPEWIEGILAKIRVSRKGKAHPPFARRARRYLKPVLKRFFDASRADLSEIDAFHRLRIRAKKLRYTMEIVAVAFPPCFRKKLYCRITELQDLMGAVNDHATAKVFFRDWLAETDEAETKAFFRGILLAEHKAHEDLYLAFRLRWTPQAVKQLKREFRACCGLP